MNSPLSRTASLSPMMILHSTVSFGVSGRFFFITVTCGPNAPPSLSLFHIWISRSRPPFPSSLSRSSPHSSAPDASRWGRDRRSGSRRGRRREERRAGGGAGGRRCGPAAGGGTAGRRRRYGDGLAAGGAADLVFFSFFNSFLSDFLFFM